MNWPRTLFWRTTLVIASVSVVFQAFVIGAIAYFALVPLGVRATDDFAARLLDVAEHWQHIPEAEQQEFSERAWREHGVRIGTAAEHPEPFVKFLPYYYLLESALSGRTGRPVALLASHDRSGGQWLWADISGPERPVLVGFSRERIGVYPPIALALIFVVGSVATFFTSAYLARRLTAPLRRLSRAAREVGSGDCSTSLPDSGPEEVAVCVRSFNRMASQVQELLAGRTTLLAGISHDLRTPLARMRLGLGMLADSHDPALAEQLMRDVDAMNELISRCLELGQGFEEPLQEVDAGALMAEAVDDARRAGKVIEYQRPAPSIHRLRPIAFRRVIANLMDNALRYGEGKPVTVEFDAEEMEVRVLDRGPGIPETEQEAVFRPFYRLEPSRSASTGGSGLGLAIVLQLARANGWRVHIGNRPGGGAAAVLQLRRASERQTG